MRPRTWNLELAECKITPRFNTAVERQRRKGMRNAFRVLAGATLAVVLSTCGGAPSETGRGDAPDPSTRPPVKRNSTPLQTSAPEAQGVDSAKLEAAYRHAETLQPLLSLLVLRNNVLVGEAYLHGAESDTAYNIKSVSKSILSALTGIALREGFVKELEQPISEFFPEHFEPPAEYEGWTKRRAETDSFKRRVTLRHLLDHTSGYAWNENQPLFWAWLWSGDYVRFFLDLPFVDEPDRKFIYNTGGTHALSALLGRTSGMTTLEFADRYLFAPTGMEVRRWDRSPEGNYIGGAEMHFTARHLARFALLYLNGGRWDGKEVLPEEWVKESTAEHVKANYSVSADEAVPESWSWGFLEKGNFTGYGYLWWRRDTRGHETFVGLGYGGQFIFIIPDLDMIVVATSAWDAETNPDRFKHYLGFFDLVDNYIIPAVGVSESG